MSKFYDSKQGKGGAPFGLLPEPKGYPNQDIREMVTVAQIKTIIVGTAIMAGDEELAAERIHRLFYSEMR